MNDEREKQRSEKFIKRWPKGHRVRYEGRAYEIVHSGRTNHSSPNFLEDFVWLRWVDSNHEFCFQCSKSDYICCKVIIDDVESEVERMDYSGFLPKVFNAKGLHTHDELRAHIAHLQSQIKHLEDLAKAECVTIDG